MSDLGKYDYELPRDLIAQQPAATRADARLLLVDRTGNSLQHYYVRDLPDILRAGDCLVLNDTRVVPARLIGRRDRTGGRWEGLFLEVVPGGLWRVLCKARGKLVPEETITLVDAQGQDDIQLHMGLRRSDGSWVVRPHTGEDTFSLLERIGRVPLPPYIRKGEMVEADREHYQTVYARWPGAIAAPTAGLHFTDSLLRRLQDGKIVVCALTLHTGGGTFRPITSDSLAAHQLDAEWGTIRQETINQIADCRRRGGRVVAVGTTSVRLLETAAADGTLKPLTGYTDLFIRPPFKFQAVDVLLTNFHLPRTTLLVLVRTFGGEELIARAYEEAIREKYRFYSYGDAMLII
ncbi:MAG: tRNA preQ1(34) S-adenosylmethionine ribosyltransferase-isomerase QueA [Thermoguttaceae bacterium]|jgi:S-adenosylmethionine:tRNA ribosyltransferase-isomerase